MKKKYLLAFPMAFLALVGVTSCDEDQTEPTTTATTTVEEGNLSSIKLDYSAVKVNYVIGEEFTAEGLKVYAVYVDGTKVELDSSKYTIDSSTFDNMTKGDYYIKVVYEEEGVTKTRSYHVGVTSILDNQNYVVGITATGAKETYSYQENFDSTGLIVKAYYKDGTTKVLNNTEYTLDSSLYNKNQRGNYEIKVSYTETYTSGSASETVEVETCYFATLLMNMKNIRITSGTATFYQYQDISTDDWKITITYEEGVTEVISSGFTTNMSTVFTDSSQASGYKTVTATYTYNGVTATATKSCRILGASYAFNSGALDLVSSSTSRLDYDSTISIMPGYSVYADSVTCGCQTFAKMVALEHNGTREENSIKLTLAAGAKINICVSSDEGSKFGLYDSEGNPIQTETAGSDVIRYEFKASAAGTYYIWTESSINVYFIAVWY